MVSDEQQPMYAQGDQESLMVSVESKEQSFIKVESELMRMSAIYADHKLV